MFGLILQKAFAAISATAAIACSTYMQIDNFGDAMNNLNLANDISISSPAYSDTYVITNNNFVPSMEQNGVYVSAEQSADELIDKVVENTYDTVEEAFAPDGMGPKLTQTTEDVIDALPQNNKKKEKDEEEAEEEAEAEAKRKADELEAQQKKELEEEKTKQEEEYKKQLAEQEAEIKANEEEYKKDLEAAEKERQAQAEQYKQDNGMEM